MKKAERQSVEIRGHIQEMTTSVVDLQLPNTIDVASIIEGDQNPMFVVAKVLEETKSSNGNIYTASNLREVCEQINKKMPYAYRGHIKDSDKSTKNPKPLTQWLYAEVREMDGKTALFAKGYVFKYAKSLREQLAVASKTKKLVPVSIAGDAYSKYNKTLGGNELSEIEIESIDWARDQAQGVRTAGAVTVTREMKDKNNMKVSEEVKKAISEMSAEDILEINPELEDKASKQVVTEMAQVLDVEESKVKEKIEEMKSTIAADAEEKKKLQEQIDNYAVDSELRSRVKGTAPRKVIKKLVLTEMKAGSTREDAIKKVLESEEGKAIISEMTVDLPASAKSNDKKSDDEAKNISYR